MGCFFYFEKVLMSDCFYLLGSLVLVTSYQKDSSIYCKSARFT